MYIIVILILSLMIKQLGYKNDLSIRKWKCEKCNYIDDRDINIMYGRVKRYMDVLAVN